MKGKYEVIVESVRLQYKFTIERNITLLQGDSATGKTTLIDMISQFETDGEDSGIKVICRKNCTVLTNRDWKERLKKINDSIVFIDEGAAFVTSTDFAKTIMKTDNYYVIATRAKLSNLPYSVREIYQITNKTSKKINKYQKTKRLYSGFKQINKLEISEIPKPDFVIVEDSNSGFEFFKSFCDEYKIPCISAKGKSNVLQCVLDYKEKSILVVADGAAFGPEIEKLVMLQRTRDIILFLPESFEWLVLKSDLIEGVKSILKNPSEYIECKEFFSWERFFTKILVELTSKSYLQYNKNTLNPVYLQENEKKHIINSMPTIHW